jgi:DNA repair protein RadC
MKEEAVTPESINGPEQVFRMMLPTMKGLLREECWALYLNRANVVTRRERLTTGTAESTLIDSREVLRSALEQQAKAVILVHNHPSGNPRPGKADFNQTEALRNACSTMDLSLLDHVILGDGTFYSFVDERVRAIPEKEKHF